MRMGSQVGSCRAALFAALGYGLLAACGGSTHEQEGSPSNAGGGGGSGSGGSGAGGSIATTGGATATTGGTANVPAWVKHRAAPVRCENHLVPTARPAPREAVDAGPLPADAAPPAPERDESRSTCTYDVDCTEKPYGQCVRSWPYRPAFPGSAPQGLPYDTCSYGCVEDADCGGGMLCDCGPEIGRCVSTYCSEDSACRNGSLCLRTETPDPCGGPSTVEYDCGTVGTDCTPSSGCEGLNGRCINGHCEQGPTCGRPFLVEGAARLARPVVRDDYSRALAPEIVELSLADRAALAAHWTDIGLMEHASVAAFARFTLELLSFGAPAALVEAANAALADELEHARLAFGLASAYGGGPVGPGPLSVERALGGADFVETVRTAFREACVGETCAAVEASEARHFARDAAVCSALTRIAADELRHAALGYRFVRWALEASPPEVARSLRAMLADELTRLSAEPCGAPAQFDATALVDHGLLPDAARAASRALALREVVAPAVRALLGTRSRRAVRAAPLGLS